jgi:hypothetical protein
MARIDIQGTDPNFRSAVGDVIFKAEKTQVGKILLADIEETKRKFVIKPYEGNDDPVFGPCNALIRAKSPIDSAPDGVGANPDAPWYKGVPDSIYTQNEDDRYNKNPAGYVGTGKGSDIELQFSPDVIAKTNCYGGKFGSLPDEVFVHECVHALRKMQGKSNPYPTRNPLYTNEEEFLAIVTTNVYMSEKGSKDLRRDHAGHSRLEPPLNTSAGFLSNPENLHLMKLYHLLWLPTFLNLAKVITAPFNPFRELVKNLAHLR